MGAGPLTIAAISVGDHVQRQIFGLTVDMDTVWATVIAGLIVIGLGLLVRAKATSGVPGKFQLVWEMALGMVKTQVGDSIGPRGAFVEPLALTLLLFIFTCNLVEAVGIGARFEFLPAPTSDINLPLAMALYVIVLVHMAAVRNRGGGGYLAHYASQPFPKALFFVNIFMNVVDEIVKPVTLTLRLFGNLFAGGLMLSLLAYLVQWKLSGVPLGGLLSVPATLTWKLFDMAIGGIQAYIFALLTIMYFGMAMAKDDAH